MSISEINFNPDDLNKVTACVHAMATSMVESIKKHPFTDDREAVTTLEKHLAATLGLAKYVGFTISNAPAPAADPDAPPPLAAPDPEPIEPPKDAVGPDNIDNLLTQYLGYLPSTKKAAAPKQEKQPAALEPHFIVRDDVKVAPEVPDAPEPEASTPSKVQGPDEPAEKPEPLDSEIAAFLSAAGISGFGKSETEEPKPVTTEKAKATLDAISAAFEADNPGEDDSAEGEVLNEDDFKKALQNLQKARLLTK